MPDRFRSIDGHGARRFYPPSESDIPLHGWRPYSDVHRERIRAQAKHGDKPGGSMEEKHPLDPDWLPVLVEEVGEVAKVLCDHRHGLVADEDFLADLRSELVQVAAMAVAWLDALDLTVCSEDCCLPHLHNGPHHGWDGREFTDG